MAFLCFATFSLSGPSGLLNVLGLSLPICKTGVIMAQISAHKEHQRWLTCGQCSDVFFKEFMEFLGLYQS